MDMKDKEDIGEYVFRKLRQGLLALPEDVVKNLAEASFIAAPVKIPVWSKPYFEYTLSIRVLWSGNIQLVLTDPDGRVRWDITTQ